MKKLFAKIKANPILWFNGMLIGMLPVFEIMLTVLPQIHEYVPESTYKMMGLIAAIGNAVIGQLKAQGTEPEAEVADA